MPDPTTIPELQRALDDAGVLPTAYSFINDEWKTGYRLRPSQDAPGSGSECYPFINDSWWGVHCLEAVHDALGPSWQCYYAERQTRSDEVTFRSESEACTYFFQLLLRDPLNRPPDRRVP